MGEPIKPEEKYHAEAKPVLARLFIALSIFLLLVFVTLSQMFAWGRVNVLSDRVVTLRQQLEIRSSKSDCLALYRNDVSTALGEALAANNRLWVSVATRPFAPDQQSQEAQAADNRRLGSILDEANTPLVDATAALAAYDAMDPKPDICPHPSDDDPGTG